MHVYRGERGSARLLLPVVEKHVARDSKEPRLLALAVFVSISGPDDAEVDVLSQVVGEIRLAGEPAQKRRTADPCRSNIPAATAAPSREDVT